MLEDTNSLDGAQMVSRGDLGNALSNISVSKPYKHYINVASEACGITMTFECLYLSFLQTKHSDFQNIFRTNDHAVSYYFLVKGIIYV